MQETQKNHVVLGKLIQAFIRAGWNPPTPSSRIAERILDDLAEVGAGRGRDSRHGDREPSSTVLSPRQRAALTLTAIGMTGPKAAQAMDVSQETIKSHLKHARHRLGASTVAHAVAIALRDEIIALPDEAAPSKSLAA
jgi:DNA-binding CsgD family transcriptional regulator